MSAPRDRDPAGRPRSARPRDELGRPLGRGAAGVAVVPDGSRLTPVAALGLAQDFLDAGRPFHAHEVLEAVWRHAPAGERDLWRGLAQIAVGLTHARRGNARGAAALLGRGGRAVGGYAGTSPHGIAAAAVASAAATLAAQLASGGLGTVTESQLRLQLRG